MVKLNLLYKYLTIKGDSLKPARLGVLLVFFFLLSVGSFAQQVTATLDTATMRIGEQIRYGISVETDPDDLVVFPEGQTFAPLEMVEGLPVDTLDTDNRFRLLKEYALTQFDSGSYTIPGQRIIVNDQIFYTDTMLVEVRDVVVDTTKQKMYPIKPAMEVPSRFSMPAWAWWVLALIILGIIIYFFFRRKKKKEEAAKNLPPYEQAIQELRKLDESHLLEKRELKEYYSQLSAAVRRYLDGEIYDHAMELTSGELIAYLEAEKNTGKLNLEQRTIENLKQILHRADLAKFANTRPDVITAREDRSHAEFIINDTKEAIPQPTEEELLQDQAYQEKLEKKRKRKNLFIAIGIVLLALGGITAYLVATKGFSYVKDNYIGHPTKELLEGEWVQSDYGNPPVSITTPKVLRRGEVELPEETQEMMRGSETFVYGRLMGEYFISLTTLEFSPQNEFDLETAVDGIYEYLEAQGARNILMKQEEFTTLNGAKGIRIFGTMIVEDAAKENAREKEYAILNFGEGNGFQQIILIYNTEDDYAEEITERIVDSVELKTPGN